MFDPYKAFDRDCHRQHADGQPCIYPRCSSVHVFNVTGVARCEYRVHGGGDHATHDGRHWNELPLGVCSGCGDPMFPLDVTPWPSLDSWPHCPSCSATLFRRHDGWYCHNEDDKPVVVRAPSEYSTLCCDDGIVVDSVEP